MTSSCPASKNFFVCFFPTETQFPSVSVYPISAVNHDVRDNGACRDNRRRLGHSVHNTWADDCVILACCIPLSVKNPYVWVFRQGQNAKSNSQNVLLTLEFSGSKKLHPTGLEPVTFGSVGYGILTGQNHRKLRHVKGFRKDGRPSSGAKSMKNRGKVVGTKPALSRFYLLSFQCLGKLLQRPATLGVNCQRFQGR